MDRMKDSGSFDWGSSPHGITTEKAKQQIGIKVCNINVLQTFFFSGIFFKTVIWDFLSVL